MAVGWRRAAVLGCVLLLAVAGLEAYTRRADTFAVAPLALPADTRMAVLIFHGSEDGDDPLLAAIRDRFAELLADQPHTAVVNYHWSPASDHRLRAAANAERLGAVLGRELAGLRDLQELRLVAHSAGAYVPDALCEAYRAAGGSHAHVEMTFLDPFGIRGFVNWRDGARRHGRCADFAAVYLNTDDPAPASNRYLDLAYNVDVTADPDRAGFPRNGHYWPLAWYLRHLDAAEARPGARDHGSLPRGAVVQR